MPKLSSLALAAALLSSGAAGACEAIDIQVLPFKPRFEFTQPMAELAKLGGRPIFGGVTAQYFAHAVGCSVSVGYRDPVLYIASELRADACAFDHVMGHEMIHLFIYHRSLQTIEKRIRARASEPDLQRVAIEELISVRPQHRALDSEGEYATATTACDGALIRLTGVRDPV